MENYKLNIAAKMLNGNWNTSETEYRILSKISEGIDYAWNNWDDEIIATYFEGEKPEQPNESFINNWVENTDFEADGYDVPQLKELFS